MEMKEMNLLVVIGLIGALMLIIGVFTAWLDPNFPVDDFSGWDVFNNKDHEFDEVDYTWAPLVALLAGVISFGLLVMPLIMNTEKYEQINNLLGLVALILAVVTVIVTYLFWSQNLPYDTHFSDVADMGIGMYLVYIGGIITIIGGIMPILKNKGIIKF